MFKSYLLYTEKQTIKGTASKDLLFYILLIFKFLLKKMACTKTFVYTKFLDEAIENLGYYFPVNLHCK